MAEAKAPKRTRASSKKKDVEVEVKEEVKEVVSEPEEAELEEVEVVAPVEDRSVAESSFDEDDANVPAAFDKVSKEVEEKTKAKEQEDLAKRIAGASLLTDEEERINKKLIEAGGKVKKKLYSDSVIPLEDHIQYESTAMIRHNEYLSLVEALRTRKALKGRVTGSCVFDGRVTAIVKYGDFFRVLIPFDFFTHLSKEDVEFIASKGNNKNVIMDRQRLRVDQRFNSEVDFIVGKVDEENGLAVADRLSAMARKKMDFYFGKNRNGEYRINEGQKVEVRIVRATENYAVAEMYGMEYRLSAEDLAVVHIPDVSKVFPVGSTAPAKILMLKREKKGKVGNIKAKISIKEGLEDRRLSCFNFYTEGSRVLATVTGVETYGIFCRLEGSNGVIDVLCPFSQSDFVNIPTIGSLVSVLITNKDADSLRLRGNISRVLKYA